jgi:AAA ATPase domain
MLLGRGPETTRLNELISEAAGGRGGALVLEGEPGVGKTALLEDAAGRASRLGVLRVAGVQSELALPYAALHQLCARMIGRQDRLPAPQAEAIAVALGGVAGRAPDRFLVSLGALGLLSDLAAQRPLLCLVDDAQWIDQESLQALAFVARRAEADSFALVFSTRIALDELAGIPRVIVAGLTEPNARELLASVVPGRLDPRVRDRIIAETHGNPLALLELPHGLSPDQLAGGFGLPDPERLSSRIEEGFLRRARAFPIATQQVLLRCLESASTRTPGRPRRTGCSVSPDRSGSVIRSCDRRSTARPPRATGGRRTLLSPPRPTLIRTVTAGPSTALTGPSSPMTKSPRSWNDPLTGPIREAAPPRPPLFSGWPLSSPRTPGAGPG